MTEVRAIGPDDWAVKREVRLAALMDSPAAFGGTYEHSASRTEQEWREWPEGGETFLAYYDDKPVGIACGWPNPEEPGVILLISMWVAPVARGGQAAGALIGAVTQWSREQGADAVELTVYDDNPRAHRIYERHGFADDRRSPIGKPGWIMRLRLGGA